MRCLLLALVSVAVAACSPDRSAAPVATVIEPGEWELVETTLPADPEDWPRTAPPRRICITEEMAAAPRFSHLFADLAGSSECRTLEERFENGHLSLRLECDAPDGDLLDIPFELTGTYTRDTIRVQTSAMGFEASETVVTHVAGTCSAAD